MLLTIAILSAIIYIQDIYRTFEEGKSNLLVSGAILTLATWNCLPLAIIVMSLTVIIAVIKLVIENLN